MLAESRSGNTSTFARPATGEPGAFRAATSGTSAASPCSSPSKTKEGDRRGRGGSPPPPRAAGAPRGAGVRAEKKKAPGGLAADDPPPAARRRNRDLGELLGRGI